MAYRYGRSYKQRWMAAFEQQLVKALPEAQGVVRWSDAEYLYNESYTPEHAVEAYCAIARAQQERDAKDA